MIKNILLLILFISISGLLYRDLQNTEAQEPKEKLSIIVTPFGSVSDENVWHGEAGPFMNALDNKTHEPDISFCDDVYSGTISGEPVLVVISGIGKVKTATCVSSVLEKYPGIKEVIVSGTGGISSNNGARIGDICINSIAGNFDLQHYASDLVGTTERKPAFWVEEADNQRVNTIHNSLVFELLAIAHDLESSSAPKEVTDINDLYHQSERKSDVFGMNECIEISGDLFWHDLDADSRARQMGKKILSELGLTKTLDDPVIITAMESNAVSSIVQKWNKSHGTSINFAYIRGASNFDHPPVRSDGTAAISAGESLDKGYGGVSIEFAAKKASEPILKLFEIRNTQSSI